MNTRLANLLRRNGKPFCSCGTTTLLLGLFFFSVANLAQGSSSRPGAPFPASVTANFAIADFDGDQLPDLATVQTGRSESNVSRYSISLQLSAGPRQTFGLTAPIGGLQLDSRDVNGDHLADLVVSTTWLGQPVAILLNDGNGIFNLVDPARFPASKPSSHPGWSEPAAQSNEVAAMPPSRFLKTVLQTHYIGFFSEDSREFASKSTARARALRRPFTTPGRAPPVVILHS